MLTDNIILLRGCSMESVKKVFLDLREFGIASHLL